jgi:cobalt-zinc-cadmium efflux system outer membrane protein
MNKIFQVLLLQGYVFMSFRTKLALLCIVAGMAMSQVTSAEMRPLEQSSAVTLSSLTQTVYELEPARHSELAQQQQINANAALANATFADVKSISLNHQNDVIGSGDGLQEWESIVEMPLWLPGQKQQQLSLSDKLSAELPAYKQQVMLAASAKVRELIWNIVLANADTKQAYQIWQSAQKLEQDVTARVKAGELAGTEGLLANTNALEMQNQYLLKKSELDFALSTYYVFTKERRLPESYEEILSDNYVIDQRHPSLMVLDQHINTLRAKQGLARFDGAVNPRLSLGVRRERGGHGENFTNSMGLGISFALDNEVYRGPAIATATKELADAEIIRQQLERELTITLFSHLHDLETKRLQLGLLNEQNETTQQYLALQQRAFELGELDLVSLLRSQSLANEVYNRKLALEVDVKHNIALINQALGIIL